MKNHALRLITAALLIAYTLPQCATSNVLSAGSSLMSTLGTNSTLSSFTSLLKTPGLTKVLGSAVKGPFTLLAPTNNAMGNMDATTLTNLTKPDNISQLGNFLKGHILPGKLNPADLAKGGLNTAGGTPLNLSGVNLGNMMTSETANIIPINKVLQ
jgi:uncharacterized surface protein with fasciclin (FAS1) repeats